MNTDFNAAQLRLARNYHGLTLEEVAARVGKTRQYLHKLETHQGSPAPELWIQLAEVLQVDPDFFSDRQPMLIAEDMVHFRKLFSTKGSIKQTALARAEIFARLAQYLDGELKLPAVHLPCTQAVTCVEDIERSAEHCRHEWGLGLGPIEHMMRLAENCGVLLTCFAGITTEIDALSVGLKRPIIVRNDAKQSTCRQRFDVAHEMGHFVLHAGQVTGDRTTESQANRFASSLLIPRAMMAKLFPRPRSSRLDWRGLSEFKLTWRMSKAAILYRARQLDLISDQQYRSGAITLRRTGEASGEREDAHIAAEQPELLRTAFDVLAQKKRISASAVAASLGLSEQLLKSVLGFWPSLSEVAAAAVPCAPVLRLIKSA